MTPSFISLPEPFSVRFMDISVTTEQNNRDRTEHQQTEKRDNRTSDKNYSATLYYNAAQ